MMRRRELGGKKAEYDPIGATLLCLHARFFKSETGELV